MAEIPLRLIHQLLELHADHVQALGALDQPPASTEVRALLRDTLASLDQPGEVGARFRKDLTPQAPARLEILEASFRKGLDVREAYNMVPGRNPRNG